MEKWPVFWIWLPLIYSANVIQCLFMLEASVMLHLESKKKWFLLLYLSKIF